MRIFRFVILIVSHFDEFCYYFVDLDYLICMSETWFRSEIPDEMVNVADYTLYRCDGVIY